MNKGKNQQPKKEAIRFSTDKESAPATTPPVDPESKQKDPRREAFQRFASRSNLMAIPKKKDQSKLWELMGGYIENDKDSIQRQISDHVEYTLARNRGNFDHFGAYQATGYSVRDRLIEFWNDTNFSFDQQNSKQIYYLSIEYLLGRALQNAVLALDIETEFTVALKDLGFELEELYEEELDPGLGNGGLGRLAACYLDSMASQNYCCWGYGLRYTFGMFRQEIRNGRQAEIPDVWAARGVPTEITRYDVKYNVRLFGQVVGFPPRWEGGEVIIALASDLPVPGFQTKNVINLRLWKSEPSNQFDLTSFNEGNYYKALEKRQRAETISSVLYPNDNTPEGKELRLTQQYFFCSATLQDIIRRFKRRGNTDWNDFPKKVGIQLNDTHPTISIPELMRLLMDVEGLVWEKAADIVRRTFAYTNHTVMPEALERWSVGLLEHVLPRHMQIIYEINWRFLENEVKPKFGNNMDILSRLSIIEEGHGKYVRMANLAIVMGHRVNGVAELHSQILKDSLFHEFAQLYPEKFINITNGVTPRRWLLQSNRPLCSLITKTLNTQEFLMDMGLLKQLREHANNTEFQEKWLQVKLTNKERLAKYLKEKMNIQVDPTALFDIQIKRIHEYKRQLMNILRLIHVYLDIKANPNKKTINRVAIFAGKAAPGYYRAKQIIKLITSVSEVVNSDPEIGDKMKIIFIPNYNVSLAEIIIPASDLSQHISTAGMEASGTSNMKFSLNGGLIIGTLDGANIEIRDEIGHENMFIFGLTADQVDPTRWANTSKFSIEDSNLQAVVDCIRSGRFGDPNQFNEIVDSLRPSRDHYLLGTDFRSYLQAHDRVDEDYQNKPKWAKMSIMSTAGMGFFSSDRSIQDYANKIWDVKPVKSEGRK